tara:strand:- start:287 stop:532 length:246 start_codon:yes stop_codon:yes gene_type:complete
MIDNKFVFNAVVSLVINVILFFANRGDEKAPSWKFYLKNFVIIYLGLLGLEYVKPMVQKGGVSLASMAQEVPEINIGTPDF